MEFNENDLRVIEGLIDIDDYNIKESTKEDIRTFLKVFRWKKAFHSAEKKYIKLTTEGETPGITIVRFLFVKAVREVNYTINLIADQYIYYQYYEDNTLAFSNVVTCSDVFLEKYKNYKEVGIKIDLYKKYEIIEITKSEYEEELISAISIV